MIPMRSQMGRLKLDDLVTIIQQIYLALYAQTTPEGILFDPDKAWSPDTPALVAHILGDYGLRPATRHTVECPAAMRVTEET